MICFRAWLKFVDTSPDKINKKIINSKTLGEILNTTYIDINITYIHRYKFIYKDIHKNSILFFCRSFRIALSSGTYLHHKKLLQKILY